MANSHHHRTAKSKLKSSRYLSGVVKNVTEIQKDLNAIEREFFARIDTAHSGA
jgi:hypothetical protein